MVFAIVFGITISAIVIFFTEDVLVIGFSFIFFMCLGLSIYNLILKGLGVVSEYNIDEYFPIKEELSQGAYIVK